MGELSKIGWTDHTFSPWIGCTKVGPGCDHCYANALNDRFKGGNWGPGAPRRRTAESTWAQVLRWNKSAAARGVKERVFPSMCDPFDNEVETYWRLEFGRLIEATPNLIWLLLTKRIGNAGDMLAEMFPGGVPDNVWVGATMVNRQEILRDGPKLKAVKERHGIKVAFLSMEPLLESVRDTLADVMAWIDWIIVGGESGHGSRMFDVAWAWGIVMLGRHHKKPVFVKQMGSKPHREGDGFIKFNHSKGEDPAEWPEHLRVQQFPEAA